MKFELFYFSGDLDTKSETTKNATWEDVENAIKKVGPDSTLILSLMTPPPHDFENINITVSEDGKYYLPDADHGKRVMGIWNYDMEDILEVEVLGNYYPGSMVIPDFEHIKKMIKTFYDTGDIPRELWGYGTKKKQPPAHSSALS